MLELSTTHITGEPMTHQLKFYQFFSRGIMFFLAVFITSLSGVTTTTAADLKQQTYSVIDLVWTGKDADRNIIFLSSKKHGQWSEPEHIIDFSSDSLHPTVDKDKLGNTWLTWTAIDNEQFQIHYTEKQNNQWHDPESLTTTTKNNIAPFLLLDKDGIPFVVWSGNNDDDDDIYFSRFVKKNWQAAQRIHPDNSVPDILPALNLDAQKSLHVTWEQYSPSGYILVSMVWNGSAWVDEEFSKKKNSSGTYQKSALMTYAIKGRLWDGRQWIKNTSDATDDLKEKETGEKGGAETIEIELPKFVDSIDNVYVKIYK